MGQAHHLAVCFVGQQDVHAYGTDVFSQRHHQFLTDGVDGWICHLCKLLAEIVEQQLWLVAQHGQGRVVTHGGRRLCTVGAHGYEDTFYVLTGITEGTQSPVVVVHSIGHLTSALQGIQLDAVGRQPLTVGLGGCQLFLQFAVVVDAFLLGVHH